MSNRGYDCHQVGCVRTNSVMRVCIKAITRCTAARPLHASTTCAIMAGTDDLVLSEVHMETCPPLPGSTWCTRFAFSLPADIADSKAAQLADTATATEDSEPELDSDGDIVLCRRQAKRDHFLTVCHSLATPVSRCGEQVWQGACLLADWLIAQHKQLAGRVVLELGAGVGLVSLMAAHFAETVYLTDADAGSLHLANSNVTAAGESSNDQQQKQQEDQAAVITSIKASLLSSNSSAVCHSGAPLVSNNQCGTSSRSTATTTSNIHVRRLNWFALFDTQLHRLSESEIMDLLNTPLDQPPQQATQPTRTIGTSTHAAADQQPGHTMAEQQQQQDQYQWSVRDVHLLAQSTVLLAADVIYDEALTDAFMHAAAQLMRWQQQQQQQQQCLPGPSVHGPAMPSASASAADATDGSRTSVTAGPRLIVAAEKRYNFTLRDMDAKAPAFEHFLTYVSQVEEHPQPSNSPQVHLTRYKQQQQQVGVPGPEGRALFHGKRLDVSSIPQSLEYDRTPDTLELWELVLIP